MTARSILAAEISERTESWREASWSSQDRHSFDLARKLTQT